MSETTATPAAVSGGFSAGGATDAGHSYSLAYSAAIGRMNEQTANELLNLEARREGCRPARELDLSPELQAALDLLSLTSEDLARKIDEARTAELARLRPMAVRARDARAKADAAREAWKAGHTESSCVGWKRHAVNDRDDRTCSNECTLRYRAWRRLAEAASALGASLDKFVQLHIPHKSKMQETHARLADRAARARLSDARERLRVTEETIERHTGRERPPAALLAKLKVGRIELARLEHDAGTAGAAHREAVAHVERLGREALLALEPLTPTPAPAPVTPSKPAPAGRKK